MSNRAFKIYCFALVLVCHRVAAQQDGKDSSRWPTEYNQPTATLPPAMGESYHHDCTAAGNMLRGWASVIHANGNYQLNTSQAAMLFQAAEAMRLHNRRQWIAFRVSNRQRLADNRQRRVDAQRAKNTATNDSKLTAAYQLSASQIERASGHILWPEVLQAKSYRDLRLALDELFRDRLNQPTTRDGVAHIDRQIEEFRRVLRNDMRVLSTSDFAAAQKFLCGLKVEAAIPVLVSEMQQPARGQSGVAQATYATVNN
ncbi:MAG: hypothetical protein U0805_14080 [Pirellulales bacterium]